MAQELQMRGIAFASLTERIDTRPPTGQLVFHMFGALAEFERNLIRERTMAGLKAARVRGRKGGRPQKLSPKDLKTVRALLRSGDVPSVRSRNSFGWPDRRSTATLLSAPGVLYSPFRHVTPCVPRCRSPGASDHAKEWILGSRLYR
jgi:hypothetical protein